MRSASCMQHGHFELRYFITRQGPHDLCKPCGVPSAKDAVKLLWYRRCLRYSPSPCYWFPRGHTMLSCYIAGLAFSHLQGFRTHELMMSHPPRLHFLIQYSLHHHTAPAWLSSSSVVFPIYNVFRHAINASYSKYWSGFKLQGWVRCTELYDPTP
jgi:hypothetical protein